MVWYNNIWFKITGKKPCYRSKEQIEEVLLQSGFKIEAVEPSGAGRKKCWILAKVKPNYNEILLTTLRDQESITAHSFGSYLKTGPMRLFIICMADCHRFFPLKVAVGVQFRYEYYLNSIL